MEQFSRIFSPDKEILWTSSEPSIWTMNGGPAQEDPALSIVTTLCDQPRWLEPYHLYDERGSELFEKICELPEYYLTRTENALLESAAARIVAAAPVECIVELGAGTAKKTVHLLDEQVRQRSGGIFAPIDVSIPGLIASRDDVRQNFPAIRFHGLHARYEEGLASIDKNVPTLFVFLGSTIGNFHPPEFVRFFRMLSRVMGPNDYLLLGADRVKAVNTLERAYDDSKGLTAEFILNVFENINRLLRGDFDRGRMRYHSRYNPQWQQIEMYSVATAAREIHLEAYKTSFVWQKDEPILVEISRKFDPARLRHQLSFFDLIPMDHFTDRKDWFSLLLFKKAA